MESRLCRTRAYHAPQLGRFVRVFNPLVGAGWRRSAIRSPALPYFPANREFYREFCKIAASGTPETVNNSPISELSMGIPYSTEQGIILSKQGMLVQEQGISWARAEIVIG